MNQKYRRTLSIQLRLPLLICILLLCTVIAVSWTSYEGIKKASLETGKQRLQSVTMELSSRFGQFARGFITSTQAAAHSNAVKQFLLSGGADSSTASLEILKTLHKDTSSVYVSLLDRELRPLLQSGKAGISSPFNPADILSVTPVKPDSCKVGILYKVRDSVYYPVIATVTHNKQLIGYIFRWRVLVSNSRSMSQLSALLGTDANLLIGNTDGSLWTDLIIPQDNPLLNATQHDNFYEYTRSGGGRVMAIPMPVANTKWTLLVEFSRYKMTEAAAHFLKWLILIGSIIIVVGSFIAWVFSRKITKPLQQLTSAASAIAGGDYHAAVKVDRSDELGELARAFNIMASQVSNAQQFLEQKVHERTGQLERANSELEAFSYSVSHDLRAPLRAINGYAMILKEDYHEKLDPEAQRILSAVVINASMMGQLINDLLAFAKMGKTEIIPHAIDMKALALSCVSELVKNDTRYTMNIDNLPVVPGDQGLMKQVWMNLLSNAVKYSSKQPAPVIHVGFKEDRDNVVYFVNDNGVGFDMKYVGKLFGIFQRLHDQQTFEGTGIGLALSKRIIDKHSGTIWAESTLGSGATFYFSLPKHTKHDA
jgi:signal transduction histidine kinase